jgi:hypothetical protein
MLLIKEAKQLYVEDGTLEVSLKSNVFAIDSKTIDLSLSIFYWITFRSTKAGIKLHTQLDIKMAIPEFILFSNTGVYDVNVLGHMRFEVNSFYIMNKGYIDYRRLFKIHVCDAFFVTRVKDNMNFRRLHPHAVDKSKGVLCDQANALNNYYAAKDYPGKIRRIKFRNLETDRTLVLLTNNFHFKDAKVTQMYKHRWKIELFFKWIKRHLKIKSFWGQSWIAVKTHVWIVSWSRFTFWSPLP